MRPPSVERATLRRIGGPGAVERWCLAAFLLTAAAFVLGVLWRRALLGIGYPSHDVYAYFYPNIAYAVQSLRDGSGLLWNPYQDCGQPFFGTSQTGLLYPVNVAFFLLPRQAALITAAILNLAIAGAGMFLLCRQLGLSLPAALAGACTFQLAGSVVQLTSWSPIHISAYVWMPAALWATERLLRNPTRRGAVLLAVVLALQMLPGFPQITFFTYELIALRVLWTVVLVPTPRRGAVIALVALGLALAVVLTAVQFLPSLEVARESLRAGRLPSSELGKPFSWQLTRRNLELFTSQSGAVLFAFAALPWLWTGFRDRRAADLGFYALATLLFFLLTLGPGMPLFDLYIRLPFTTAFRDAGRMVWVSGFALCVVIGFGFEAILRLDRGRAAIVASVVAGAAMLHVMRPSGLAAADWVLLGVIVLATAGARRPGWTPSMPAALLLLLLLRIVVWGEPPFFDLRGGDLYNGAASAFRTVRERLTAQDRVLVVNSGLDPYPFTPKIGSLYRIPNIFDYEPQATRSYAEFFTYMRAGHMMERLNDWYWVFGSVVAPTLQRPLFDLTAARYVIVNPSMERVVRNFTPALQPLDGSGEALLFENAQALPRARYVPSVVVMPDDAILPALAEGTVDPHRTALLTEPPHSGFMGSPTDAATGSADIVVDQPERVVVRVHATAPGFLVLADQYFPGWRVRVDGQERELVRANYTFRLVEVPGGESEVEFRYQPSSLTAGAILSLLGIALCIAIGIGRRSRASTHTWIAPRRSAV